VFPFAWNIGILSLKVCVSLYWRGEFLTGITFSQSVDFNWRIESIYIQGYYLYLSTYSCHLVESLLVISNTLLFSLIVCSPIHGHGISLHFVLVLHCFVLPEFCSFPHLVCILFIYNYFIFRGININSVVSLISNSAFSLRYT
jgi:hypothetical protein